MTIITWTRTGPGEHRVVIDRRTDAERQRDVEQLRLVQNVHLFSSAAGAQNAVWSPISGAISDIARILGL